MMLPALRAGAAGYLTKDATGETLLKAIRDVAAGQTVLDAAVQRRLVEMVTAPPAPASTVASTGCSQAGRVQRLHRLPLGCRNHGGAALVGEAGRLLVHQAVGWVSGRRDPPP